MSDKKNDPYTRSPYSPSAYDPNRYEAVSYQPASYTPTNYDGAGYVSGAPLKDELVGKLNRKEARLGVVGLGYVGLPLAVEAADAGISVVGIDVDPRVVRDVNAGKSHVADVSSDRIAGLVASGRLRAGDDYAALAKVDCISICVPTPLTKTKDPDISHIAEAVDALMPHLKAGQLVALESTTYPGTTEELIASRVVEERGLRVGEEIFVAFSPERVDPGNPTWNTKNTPKVVGGVTPACAEAARALYGAFLDEVHVVGSAREAETVKLLENTFRAVNIGLVNEFLLMCNRLEIDVWNVIEAASTKPFGFMPFYPGPGLGGHCIPLDPLYMSWKAKSVDFYNRFIELATDINGNMPRFVVGKLADLLNDQGKALKGSRVMILGMAYKPNVADLRESPGLEIYRLLRQKGAWVEFHDPHVPAFTSTLGNTAASSDIGGDVLSGFDAVVLVADHDAFDYAAVEKEARVVLDCRDGFGKRGIRSQKVVRL